MFILPVFNIHGKIIKCMSNVLVDQVAVALCGWLLGMPQYFTDVELTESLLR